MSSLLRLLLLLAVFVAPPAAAQPRPGVSDDSRVVLYWSKDW